MTTQLNSQSRKIVGMMFGAVAITLVGHEASGKTKVDGARVLLGGTIGTAILVLMTNFDEAAGEFAQGLATISLISAGLINGGPLFSSITKLTASTPSTPSAAATPSTPTAAPAAAKGK